MVPGPPTWTSRAPAPVARAVHWANTFDSGGTADADHDVGELSAGERLDAQQGVGRRDDAVEISHGRDRIGEDRPAGRAMEGGNVLWVDPTPAAREDDASLARQAGRHRIHAHVLRDGSRFDARIGKRPGYAEEGLTERQIELNRPDGGVRPGIPRQLAPQGALAVVGDTGIA